MKLDIAQSRQADATQYTSFWNRDSPHLDTSRAHGSLALRAAGSNQILRPLQQLRRHALACI